MNNKLYISNKYNNLVEALHDALERASLDLQLPAYLESNRWFGAHTRHLQSARFERWVEVPNSGGACLCVVTAIDASNNLTDYLLYLRPAEPEEEQTEIADGMQFEDARQALLRLLTDDQSLSGFRLDAVAEVVTTPRCEGEGRTLQGEQSNTSVILDESCIMKLYRKLEQGRNPEIELGRYLSNLRFDKTPSLLAFLKLSSSDGYDVDALVLHEYVPNQGDCWSWALQKARLFLENVEQDSEAGAWLDQETETLQGASNIGSTLAEFHSLLARADIEGIQPEQASQQDFDNWVESVQNEANNALEALNRVQYPDESLKNLVAEATSLQPDPPSQLGLKTRIHGDLHLGQLLVGKDRFLIIDLEGEPAKPLFERNSLESPLVDVAGMLRSWNYVAMSLSKQYPEKKTLLSTWENLVSNQFLRSYIDAAGSSDTKFLPQDDQSTRQLLDLFKLRKALYELRYELDYRPDWVDIPAVSIKNLLESNLR